MSVEQEIMVSLYCAKLILMMKIFVCFVWCPGQNKRIALLSLLYVVKGDLSINSAHEID
jgi:hypothetical protein